MRQSGVIAAAALYAIDHNWDRLAEDHEHARHLSEGLANIKGLEIDVPRMETNLVFFEVRNWAGRRPAGRGRKERGVGIGANTATRIRAVTHLDVNRADIDTALKVISDALAA